MAAEGPTTADLRSRLLAIEHALRDLRLDASSPLVGRTLREAEWPPDTLVVAIMRAGAPLFPRASTRLEAGDQVTILTIRGSEPALARFLERKAPPPS